MGHFVSATLRSFTSLLGLSAFWCPYGKLRSAPQSRPLSVPRGSRFIPHAQICAGSSPEFSPAPRRTLRPAHSRIGYEHPDRL